MSRKKVSKRVKIAYRLLQDEGMISVGIRTLEFIQKHQKKDHKKPINKIDVGAIYEDVLEADVSRPANANWKAPKKKKDSLVVSWLMPPPGEGSGGHMTLFRNIKAFEYAGHTCKIYLHNPGEHSTVESVRAVMGNSFPKVKAEMQWLKQDEDMSDKSDIIFATSWPTAYTVYKSKVKAKKFYFVQDFEPYFYPVGSHYILAETTYKLGLRGITAGGWLSKRLNDEYNMTADPFFFGSDSTIYKNEERKNRKEIVFYARPTTARRAFEIGILALDKFHQMHPEYAINFIGWDVSEFDIPFPHNNLGILSPKELNDLYNRCSASLVMSLTNMSLLPLELLSSGCIPVVNEGENNTLVSDNKHIVYSAPDPLSLAKKLSEVVSQKNLAAKSKQASQSVKNCSWEESGKLVVKKTLKAFYSDGNK